MVDDPRQSRSWIALERIGPGASRLWFGAAASVMGALVAFLLIGLVPEGVPFRVGEVGYLRDNGLPLAHLYKALGATGARIVASILAGVAVTATAFAARRLSHSNAVGLVAPLLLALDPRFLAEGHLALAHAPLVALSMLALAAFLSDRDGMHWWGAVMLSLAATVDLTVVLWGGVLGAMVLMRGHIYAAPKHLGTAAGQTVGLPLLVGAVAHGSAFVGGRVPGGACLAPPWWDVLLLRTALDHGGGFYGVHNPATWFAGLGALVFLAAVSFWFLGRDFRVARLPGRVQLRLTDRLPRTYGRALWILLLVVFAPVDLWLPLLAIALGIGVQELSQDAKVFGSVIHVAAVLFALAYLVRLWPLVAGTADAASAVELAQVMPWGRVQACTG